MIFDKVTCPYCFMRFSRRDVAFRCDNRSCAKYNESDMPLIRFYGKVIDDNIKGHVISPTGMRLLPPTGAKCDVCGHESHKMACPHCHNTLAPEMVKSGGRIIAIVGARNSGKTNYITVLIDELERQMYKLSDRGVLPVGYPDSDKLSTNRHYRNKFYRQLYENTTAFEGTDINDEMSRVPLIYNLNQKGHNDYLVFYDTAGENFANLLGRSSTADGTSENADVKFLLAADAIIYLLDTFTIPSVHDDLAASMKLAPINEKNPRYDDILATLIQYFQSRSSKETRRVQNTPIAFAFSKFDAVLNHPTLSQALPNLDRDSNSRFLDGNGLDLGDLDSVSSVIQSALQNYWHEGNFLLNVDNFFKNYHFFGFSALGNAPGAGNKLQGRPQPYRVLDPLMWALTQLGYKFKERR